MSFVKDPAAELDYTVDWTKWLAGDTISTSSWTIPSGLTKGTKGESNTTKTATIWLKGGTLGTEYTVTNKIVTVAGRTDERSFTITIEDR
jgi:hypothetical protein